MEEIYNKLNDYLNEICKYLEVQESTDYQFKKGMICYRADAIIGGTVSKYNGFVRVKKAAASV